MLTPGTVLQNRYRIVSLIWIGHPAELGGDCLWSGLEIDYIAVESLP